MDEASVETIPRYSVRNSKAQSNVKVEGATEISGEGTGYGRFLFHADLNEFDDHNSTHLEINKVGHKEP